MPEGTRLTMMPESSAFDAGLYRVLIEDRLAIETEHGTLDRVLDDLDARLRVLGKAAPDADLVVWRAARVEAIVQCRGGRVAEVRRLAEPARRRARVTIGSLMLIVLVCAPVLAALRTRAGVAALGSVVMLGLFGAIAGSFLMSVRHVVAFFRDSPR